MSRIAYVNGRYVPHHAAGVHIEDRGYQFADGVYEVMAVDNTRLADAARITTGSNAASANSRSISP